MFNCHEYRELINYDIDPEKSWLMVEALGIDYDINNHTLDFIIDVINKKCNNSKVKVINEHNEIIDILIEEKLNDVDMYNIDNHHDITYHNDNSKANLENWVIHARNKNLIKNYNWVHTDVSDMCLDSPISFVHACYKDVNLDLIPNFDLVVLCISKHFTPMKYWVYLIDVLLSNMKK